MIYTVYDLETKEMLWTVDCPEALKAEQVDGELYGILTGSYDAALYAVNDEGTGVVLKETFPGTITTTEIVADGEDTVTLSNLPVPTTLTLEGLGTYTSEDGEFTFSTDEADTYLITCQATGYLTKEFTIIATEP